MKPTASTVLLIITLASTAYALKCNLCISAMTGGCTIPEDKEMAPADCGNVSDTIQTSCVAMAQVIDKNAPVAIFIRGCAYTPKGSNDCNYIKNVTQGVFYCESCTGDLCNNK